MAILYTPEIKADKEHFCVLFFGLLYRLRRTLMPCRFCTNLPEFYCNNCREPLCYPCLLKAYIIEQDRAVDVPKTCAICTKEFNNKKLWELRIQKIEYWDTENPTRSNTI